MTSSLVSPAGHHQFLAVRMSLQTLMVHFWLIPYRRDFSVVHCVVTVLRLMVQEELWNTFLFKKY